MDSRCLLSSLIISLEGVETFQDLKNTYLKTSLRSYLLQQGLKVLKNLLQEYKQHFP